MFKMNGIQKIYLALTKKMISAAYLRQQAALLFIFQFFATASSLALPYLSKLLIDKSFLARDPKIFVRLAFVSAAVLYLVPYSRF
jgi:ABC-type bacteriocin/lantibiotic exporter with double-glycine peptidase domain